MPEANNTQSNNDNGASQQTAPESAQPTTPSAVAPPTPPTTSPPTAAQNGPVFGEVLTAIQSMPEQIVKALREAAPQPKTTPKTETNNQSDTGNNDTSDNKQPGKKTFAQWWFGG